MTPDLDELVRGILARLEFPWDPEWVQHVDLWPGEARVSVFRANAEGQKYVDPKTGDPAVDTFRIPVKRFSLKQGGRP